MKKILFICAILFSIAIPGYSHADEVIPAIISITPNSGTTDGGNSVSISGAAFESSTVIKVNGVSVSINFIDSNNITITMPAGSAGFIDFSASNGIVAAISNNIYEYVVPIPAPAPSPTPAPTPPPKSPDPAPAPPQSVSEPSPVLVVEQEPSVVSQESYTEDASVDDAVELVDLSKNSYLLYEDGIENLVIENTYNVPNQFLLKERVDGKWVTVSKSYQFNNNVVYLNTNMNIGSTYKVVVRIDGVTTIVSWFKVLMVLDV